MSIMTIEEDAAMQVRIAKRQAAREVEEAREAARREVEAATEKALKESKRYGKLMASLAAEERFDDIKRIAEDPELAESLYAHYGL